MTSNTQTSTQVQTVTIVGGGFSGAACAIHLSRRARAPLDIRIVEPRREVGRGLAYSAADPHHRLNNVDAIHFLYPDPPDHFRGWWENAGRRETDPGAIADGGRLFVRRHDFGSYVAEEVTRHGHDNPSGSTIAHIRDRVDDIVSDGGGLRVVAGNGGSWLSGVVVLATGNEPASVPSALASVSEAANFIGGPWDLTALTEIAREATVLIVGSGLTAADVLASLARLDHTGPIKVVSRRGLWSHDQRPTPPDIGIWEALNRPTPPFVDRHGLPNTATAILRAVRADVAAGAVAGDTWHSAFDDLRDAVRALWPKLPAVEKRRIIRHLRPWYEIHRFRVPPQNKTAIDGLRQSGQLSAIAGHLITATTTSNGFSVTLRKRGEAEEENLLCAAIINCTGPMSDPRRTSNTLVRQLLARGDLAVDAAGAGIDVDLSCRANGDDGRTRPGLFAIGPPTRSSFGEASSVPFILRQLDSALPAIFEHLGTADQRYSGCLSAR